MHLKSLDRPDASVCRTYLFPRRDAPLGAAVDDVAELLRDGRRLRAERLVHLQHVPAAVAHLLDAVHRAGLQGIKQEESN